MALGFDVRECIHAFFFSSLGSWCCHPLCSCINRPGVTCPADSTFDCNCAPWWLTAVSPGWCGWKCVKQEGDHILCFPLVCLYLRVSVHKSWFPYSTVCIQELFYADELLKTKSTLRSPLIELQVTSFLETYFTPLKCCSKQQFNIKARLQFLSGHIDNRFTIKLNAGLPAELHSWASSSQTIDVAFTKRGQLRVETGTLPSLRQHHLDKMHFSVKLDRPLCLLWAPSLSAQHCIHISLFADR